MGFRIAWLTDMDIKGSGYKNLSVPLIDGLIGNGHELISVGFGYKGEEHFHDFPIIPASGVKESLVVIGNLLQFWKMELLIVALDIPLNERLLTVMQPREFPYIGITPVEAGPLCKSWAAVLMSMDKSFIISDFGAKEAQLAGVPSAEHIVVGVDRNTWRPVTNDERVSARGSLGVMEDEYFVLTVADNQERKNLSRTMEIMKEVLDRGYKVKWGLVTRKENPFGWRLDDLAFEMKMNNHIMIFERGMEFSKLWMIYAAADAFVLTSKADGAGLPILEAMACGIPTVATNCTGPRDHLSDGRGFLIDYDYVYRDPFGNGKRYFASIKDGANKIIQALTYDNTKRIQAAHEYVDKQKWETSVLQLENAVQEVMKKKVNK